MIWIQQLTVYDSKLSWMAAGGVAQFKHNSPSLQVVHNLNPNSQAVAQYSQFSAQVMQEIYITAPAELKGKNLWLPSFFLH